MVFMQHSAVTDVGIQRTNNEDAFYSDPVNGLWIVADGMGGHESGEVASLIAINTVRDTINTNKSLSEAIQSSHAAIITAGNNGIGSQGMGSTIVALQSSGNTYQIHVLTYGIRHYDNSSRSRRTTPTYKCFTSREPSPPVSARVTQKKTSLHNA